VPRRVGSPRAGHLFSFVTMTDFEAITISHTPFAELDLLLAEDASGREARWRTAAAGGHDDHEPETIDAFNTQILAGLVSP
jgi:hypothetical protein